MRTGGSRNNLRKREKKQGRTDGSGGRGYGGCISGTRGHLEERKRRKWTGKGGGDREALPLQREDEGGEEEEKGRYEMQIEERI